jgi:hypothetical protein
MPNQVNYKQKYEDLKMKYMQDVDTAFRLGFEQGSVQGMQDAQLQQQQAQAEADQAAIGQGQGSEGTPAGAEQQANPNGGQIGDMEPDSENPAGSELDQHIAKLESMVSKAELSPDELKKAVSDIKAFRVQATEMKKSSMAISGIAKALHKPAFKIGRQASHNMNDNAKRAVGMQEKIVSDIMKSWADEEKTASNSISKILGVEGLVKKD